MAAEAGDGARTRQMRRAMRSRPEDMEVNERDYDGLRGRGHGGQGASSRGGESHNAEPAEDGKLSMRRDELTISDVGSLCSMRRPPAHVARAALLGSLTRPRKRARSDGVTDDDTLRHGGGGSGAKRGARRDEDAEQEFGCGGATANLAMSMTGARRRLRGKQPPRAGIG